jgi:hypothetical protein
MGAKVSWRGLLLALLLLVLLSAAAGAIGASWVLRYFTLHMPLQAQQVQVLLPDELPVAVEVVPQEAVAEAGTPTQEFPVQVNDTFRTVVRVDTRLPVRMDVPFRGEIPVNLDLPVNTKVRTRVLGIPLELPVEGEIPLRFKLPVDLVIPIDQVLPMKFDLPVSTRINQTVNVRVRTQQLARIRLDDPRLSVILQSGEIAVPLSWLSLVGPGNGAPAQLGPLAQPPSEP